MDPESLQIRRELEEHTYRIRFPDILRLEKSGDHFRCILKSPDADQAPEWVLSYSDSEFHAQLEAHHFRSQNVLKQSLKWIGGFKAWQLALMTLVCLFLFFQAAMLGMQYAYKLTPKSYDLHLGTKIDSSISNWIAPCQSPALDSFFIKGMRQLTLPTDDFPHRVVILNDPMENAVAVPGGTIYVFRGLLEKSSSPDEILGVLGHEISHSELRHSVRQMIQSAGTTYLISLTVGMAIEGMDLLEGIESALEMGSALFTLRYSRDFEIEADSMGILRMHQAGLKVGPLDSLLTALSPKPRVWDRVLRLLSTHPLTVERSRRFQSAKTRETFPPDSVFSMERENWARIKNSCVAKNDSTPIWKKVLR